MSAETARRHAETPRCAIEALRKLERLEERQAALAAGEKLSSAETAELKRRPEIERATAKALGAVARDEQVRVVFPLTVTSWACSVG